MNKELEKIVIECIGFVKEDPIHHLGVEWRNRLMDAIQEKKIASYLLLNSAIKALEKWREAYKFDNTPFDLVKQISEYLSGRISDGAFLSNIKYVHSFMDNRLQEEKFSAIYAGYASVMCGYEILNNRFTTKSFNEFESDPTEWQSCFYASLAWNDGCEDLKKINKEKNKEFWLWFLTDALKLSHYHQLLSIEKYLTPETNLKKIPLRRQIKVYKDDTNIQYQLNKLTDYFYIILLKKNWKVIKIESFHVANKFSNIGYYKLTAEDDFHGMDNMQAYQLCKDISAGNILQEVRKSMYRIEPQEGAWFSVVITINREKNAEFEFNYDKKPEFFDKWVDKSVFVEDFAQFKRDKKYIAEWLEKILLSYTTTVS